MGEHRDIPYGQRFPESLLRALQEFVSTYSSPNFKIVKASSSSIKVAAVASNDEVALGIDTKWRYVSADVTAAHPGGAAGSYDVYAVASDNDFVASGGTPPETDNTDYTWGLRILVAGGTPTGNHNGKPIARYRKVGTLTWDGSAITGIAPLVGGVGQHAATHVPAGIDGLDYSLVIMRGTLGARPAAAAANANLIYFAYDTNGGTFYRSTGSAWEQGALGVTQAPTIADGSLTPAKTAGTAVVTGDSRLSDARVPTAHQATHGAGSSDPLAWTTIHGKGTLAGRPTAGSTNAGYTYFATDVSGGTVYRSDGSAWTQTSFGLTAAPTAHEASHEAGGSDALPWSAINGVGTLGARPAAASTNNGYTYLATDVNGGTLYRSNGASWVQSAYGVSQSPSNTAIAQAINLYGTLAARPAAAGSNQGFTYYATDTATLYENTTGGGWTPIASATLTITTQSASYTVALGDAGTMVQLSNAGAMNLTVPPNSSVAFPVGTTIVLVQTGAGQVTVVQGAGVTVNANPGKKLAGQYAQASLVKVATDTWLLAGNLTP